MKKSTKKFTSKKYTLLSMLVIIIFALYSSDVLGQTKTDEDFNNRQDLVLETTVTLPMKYVVVGNSNLDYLIINYSWLPESDYRQQLLSYTSYPQGEVKDDVLIMETSSMKNFEIQVKTITKTSSSPIQIDKKVEFPLRNLDSSFSKYIAPSGNIDMNQDIRSKAAELAAGEDDAYVVVFNIADWVNSHIEYNLSTSNVEASFPASWVYANKQGVCDEISNLFISMTRSVGIPARFVSGISYTNDEQFANPWGPHGWAEVYFPEYGWVPFDPTYNQLGYVDATHIKLESDDEREAVEYVWRGKNIDVTSGKLVIENNVISRGEITTDDFTIDVSFLRDEVSIGSYNVVEATIQNKRNYYVAADIAISKVEGLEVISEQRQDILLKPKTSKKVYWIVKVDALDRDFIYTFPISVYSSTEEMKTEFKASSGKTKINLESAENFIDAQTVKIQGQELSCVANKLSAYVGDSLEITCTTNSQREMILCVEDVCSTQIFSQITKTYTPTMPGYTTIKISAKETTQDDSTKTYSFLSFNVIDETDIETLVNYTQKIMFDEEGQIRVKIIKNSSSTPLNVTTSIIYDDIVLEKWGMASLSGAQEFILIFQGNNFEKNGLNEVTIKTEYFDELGKYYIREQNVEIELYNLNFMQRVQVFLNSIF